MFESVGIQLFVALLLGAAIGLERESSGQTNETLVGGGVRTFALVSLLGALAGLFYINNLPLVFGLMSAAFVILLSSYYVMASWHMKDFGLTTEMSFVLTFLIGISATTGIIPLQLVVAVAVVLILILALKDESKRFIAGITQHEVDSFISYAIVALVILPFLPNVGYTIADVPFLRSLLEGFGLDIGRFETLELLNPRKLWFIVVLVTGIDVIGYILSKFVGTKKGFTLTSFIGGFVSSTSTTQSLAQRSKASKTVNYLVGAALLANMASFFQVFLLVGPLNAHWLVSITPALLAIILSAGLLAYYYLRQPHEEEQQTEGKVKKIFSIVPALKFALLLVTVKIITGLCLVFFGQSGFLISSIIASFAGLDAILVNLATLAGQSITFEFALLTFLLVNATNLLSKSVYSFLQGDRKFALRFFVAALLIIASSGVAFLFV
jgi:uncharacterized membrane protein (DUF4010 family)